MTDETNFAMPPAEGGDEMGFAAAPPADDEYVGQVDETPVVLVPEPPSTDNDAPIVLGAPETVDDEPTEELPAPVPVEPTGPSPMQVWNEEWQETLKARKDEENAQKAKLLEEAKVSMETFAAQREQKKESKMAKNRQDEQEKLEAIEADLENDNSWQKVCKMVELSHDSAESAADVARMRDVLIHLKNDTAKAIELGA